MARRAVPTRRLGDLGIDWSLYPKGESRAAIDSEMMAQVKESFAAGVRPHPIVITEEDVIVDGVTTYFALHDTFGDDYEVRVQVRSYPDRAAILADAIALNQGRGKDLTKYQYLRCLELAENENLSLAALAGVLHMRIEALIELQTQRVGRTVRDARVAVKSSIKHLVADGHRFTAGEVETNKHLSGQAPLFHVNQLIMFFGNEPFVQDSPALAERCQEMIRLITAYYTARG